MKGILRDDILRNVQLQVLTIWRIETIGEVVGSISQDFCNAHTEIQWSEITGIRHRMIHGYDSVDTEIVWRTSAVKVPLLVQRVSEAVLDCCQNY